jgi:hypothetical protein
MTTRYGEARAALPKTWEGRRLTQDHLRDGRRVVVAQSVMPASGPVIDTSWLKAAAECFDISPDISDYVINEVPACTADIPNRNYDAHPYSEWLTFRPYIGRIAYQTFIGSGTFVDHQSKEPKKAKGVILDSYIAKDDHGFWHCYTVNAWSRSKDPVLAKRILEGKDDGYSMACLIEGARCSWCGYLSQGNVTCKHINGGAGKGRIIEGKLVYENLAGLNYVELSHVGDRADVDSLQRWSRAMV